MSATSIDDSDPSIFYDGANWSTLQDDTTNANFKGTLSWTENANAVAEFSFTGSWYCLYFLYKPNSVILVLQGTGVEVYGDISATSPDEEYYTWRATFTLDNGNHTRFPPFTTSRDTLTDSENLRRALFYEARDVSELDQPHTLRIENLDGGPQIFFALDEFKLIYVNRSPVPTVTTRRPSIPIGTAKGHFRDANGSVGDQGEEGASTGAIVGGVIGGLVVLIAIAGGIFYMMKRKRARRHVLESEIKTYPQLI
ncbi:hypothetical protein FA15DRAFT_706526 [Coprinopsis marcescibilis]|uniref:Uncharacterized protein n=1 Tax=Coprinopsis marcescibilis TaxID=230819 RepID=A0A5C3KP15_COPMA|nr:hypothetical protein FA15DRAFT_706526 [Coprinopsis marcescibilis]